MNVKIEGKVHREGVSRSGKEYSFHEIHFLAPLRGVDGKGACTKIVNDRVIRYDDILIGQVYNMELDINGDVVSLSPARA